MSESNHSNHSILRAPPSDITSERLFAALTMIGDGVWEWVMTTGKIHFSPGYFHMLGYPDRGFPETYEAWAELVHPDDLPIMNGLIEEYRAGKRQTHAVEFRMCHKDGSWRWLLSRGCSFLGPHLLGTHIDITADRQTRDSLAATRDSLIEAVWKRTEEINEMSLKVRREMLLNRSMQERLRRMAMAVDQSPVSVMMTDAAGRIQYVNKKFEEVSGWSFEEIRGLNPRILKSGAQSAEFYAEMWRKLTRGATWRGELHNRRRDGSDYWEMALIAPLQDDDGLITGYLALKEDITALHEAEVRNQALRDELLRQQPLCLIGETMANASHSMKNLLTVFQGGLFMLHNAVEGVQTREVQAAKSILEAAVFRLRISLGELLNFSKNRTPVPEQTDVTELIDHVRQSLRGAAQVRRVTVPATLNDAPITAWVDQGQLEGALLNLCVNAFDAMPDGGELVLEASRMPLEQAGQGELVFDAGTAPPQPGTYLALRVSDTGTGIDPAILPKMFEPFFSTKGSRGTGLGLCNVRQFVRDHGGSVYVRSDPGAGTTFTLVLPPSIFEAPSSATE